mgnify:CR=1 FL=1
MFWRLVCFTPRHLSAKPEACARAVVRLPIHQCCCFVLFVLDIHLPFSPDSFELCWSLIVL